jgi:hypothetical protein
MAFGTLKPAWSVSIIAEETAMHAKLALLD